MTQPPEDAVAFDKFLGASTPGVDAMARALRLAVLLADVDAPRLRAAIAAQLAIRQPAGQ